MNSIGVYLPATPLPLTSEQTMLSPLATFLEYDLQSHLLTLHLALVLVLALAHRHDQKMLVVVVAKPSQNLSPSLLPISHHNWEFGGLTQALHPPPLPPLHHYREYSMGQRREDSRGNQRARLDCWPIWSWFMYDEGKW